IIMASLSEVNYNPSKLKLLIDGLWVESESEEYLPVVNPATGKQTSKVPLTPSEEIDAAATSCSSAFEKWKEVPIFERIQYLFRMKYVFEEHFEDLARLNTQNH